MAKKKGKGKKGANKGKGKEVKVKKPTEKELFMAQVSALEERLNEEEQNLAQERCDLELWKEKWSSVVESREACVSYLKRSLQKETDECVQVQEQLQLEKDLSELMEKRAMGRFSNVDRNREVMRSMFLQQKLELEGKLSLLKEVRLTKDSQVTNIKRLEDALEAKSSALRETSRNEDLQQVSRLLSNREEFRLLAEAVRSEWKEAFELRLPVYARKQLDDNVTYRNLCEEVSKRLLAAQERSNALKELEKTLGYQKEIQDFADHSDRSLEARYKNRFDSLWREKIQLQSGSGAVGDVEAERFVIKEKERVLFREMSESHDVQEILNDLEEYRKKLRLKIEDGIDRNGLMSSVILRGGAIFKNRRSKVVGDDEDSAECDVLEQIRMLLEVALPSEE